MAELTIHVHHHFDGEDRLDHLGRQLDALLTQIRSVHAQGAHLIMLSQESIALLGRIDVATNNIAADLRVLKDKIGTGEDVELKAELEKVATQLEGIAASTDDPVPEP